MRKLILTVAGAAALTMASAANATVNLLFCSMSCTGPATTGSTTTIGYSEAPLDNPTFTEWLTFSNDLDGLYSVSLSTSSASVDFTSAVLSDGITNYALHFVGASGPNEFWGLDTTFIPMGTYTLLIQGNNNDTGNLGGTVTINPAPGVPEPATWAMMLLGFGAIGWQLRRRARPVLAQAV
jgi:hypothetical protein